MKKRRIGICLTVVLAFLIGVLILYQQNNTAEAANLVIVLDPGHDDSHTGARGNGLNEETLNLQIALACRNELMTYEGVTVYMVRDTGACPYGGFLMGSSTACNRKRVEFAKSVGADAYISLHNNSSTNSSAHGAGVYYPTQNYNSYCGKTGEGLARKIIEKLAATGLQNRGISVRYSEDNTRYPDNSLADYYGVIKNSKLKGIPAIIVEHAFVSNPGDAAQYLGSLDKLWTLGALDAQGIAQYYGLKKKAAVDASKAVISNHPRNQFTEYVLQAEKITGADSIRFAVWSDAGGFDDLNWYNAAKDVNGCWTAVVPLLNHRAEGGYSVDVYANGEIYVGHTQFTVEGPSLQEVAASTPDAVEGTFEMQLNGVYSGTYIQEVRVAAWPEGSMEDLRWITAQDMGDDSYLVHFDIADFQYRSGTYWLDTYVTDVNGIQKCLDSRKITIDRPEMGLTVSQAEQSAAYRVRTEQIPYGNGVQSMKFELLDASGNAVQYKACKEEDGQWSAFVYPPECGTEGVYQLLAYGTYLGGREELLGQMQFEAAPIIQEISGVKNEFNQKIWAGSGVELLQPDSEHTFDLRINPWCDYKWIRSAVEKSTEQTYTDFLAYELSWFEADVSGGAVSKDAAFSGAVTITCTIPEGMRNKQLSVFQAVGEETVLLQEVEAEITEDGTRIIFQLDQSLSAGTTPGTFVLAVRQERVRGDANGDSRVDLNDATLILRAALKISALDADAAKYCDIDGNGVIDLVDAQAVLRAALKIQQL